MRTLPVFVFVLFLATTVLCSAQSQTPAEADKPNGDASSVKLATPESATVPNNEDQETDMGKKKSDVGLREIPLSVTQHSVEIAGKQVAYTATAGTFAVKGDEGKTKANMFFVAYTVEPEKKGQKRPITFCFNGGPGSSSVWLHLGMLGPRKVKLPEKPKMVRPPAKVIDNPYSLLDVTDLVFIDPVSTGYSHPAKGKKADQFHGYEKDIKSVGRFIFQFTTSHGRWASPKFLCGESYGTLRAAGLAKHLADRYNLKLNGIVLVSAVLDFRTISFDATNDLPYILFLPSYATTAWYHGRLDKKWQKKSVSEVAAAAREFAFGDYASALLQGESLTKKQRNQVVARYAELTGLSREFIRRADLRINMGRFAMQLLRKKGLGIGRFDGRYASPQRDETGAWTKYDASAAALFGPFTTALYQVMRQELGVKKQIPYEILTGKVHPWDYSDFTNEYVQSAESLAEAMVRNRYLKVFVAAGYYDLATPFAAAEYTMDHLDLDQRRNNITIKYYKSGHMVYVRPSALRELRKDLLAFYEAAEGA